jgi:hypothetical protein
MAQDRKVTGDSGHDEAEPDREPRDANTEAEQGGHEANVNQVREEPVRASRHEDDAQVAERHEERDGQRE